MSIQPLSFFPPLSSLLFLREDFTMYHSGFELEILLLQLPECITPSSFSFVMYEHFHNKTYGREIML